MASRAVGSTGSSDRRRLREPRRVPRVAAPVTAAATHHAVRQSGPTASASTPARTNPGPGPALTVAWADADRAPLTARATSTTRAGEAAPAPALPRTTPAANHGTLVADATTPAPRVPRVPAAPTTARGRFWQTTSEATAPTQ